MRPLAWAGRILAFATIGSYPFLTHAALIAPSRWTRVAAVLISVQVLLMGAFFVLRSTSKHRWPLALLGVLVLAASWQSAHESLLAVSGVPHALINAGLLIFFGASLLPGRQALITALALRIDPHLPEPMIRYSRRVTIAWTIFFAAQLVISLALFVLAPLAVWSLFVNVLNGPLIVMMFLCEYGYRHLHFRHYRHASIADMVRAFASPAGATSSKPVDQG